MTLAFRITPVELTTRNIDRVTTFQSDHCRTDCRIFVLWYDPEVAAERVYANRGEKMNQAKIGKVGELVVEEQSSVSVDLSTHTFQSR